MTLLPRTCGDQTAKLGRVTCGRDAWWLLRTAPYPLQKRVYEAGAVKALVSYLALVIFAGRSHSIRALFEKHRLWDGRVSVELSASSGNPLDDSWILAHARDSGQISGCGSKAIHQGLMMLAR